MGKELCFCVDHTHALSTTNLGPYVDENRAFYQLMSKTQFMSLALIAIGFCSRLSLMSKAWTNELADAYTLLGTWMKTFPKETITSGDIDYEQQLPSSIEKFFTETIPDIPAELATDVASEAGKIVQSGGNCCGRPSDASKEQSSQYSNINSAFLGMDLGEVILRTEQLATSKTKVGTLTIRKPSKAIPKRAAFSSDDEAEPSSKNSHKNLLGELDTIFGNAPSPKESTSTPTKRKQTDDFDLDSLFGDNKKTKIKNKKLTGSADVSRGSSPTPGKVVEKSKKTEVGAGRVSFGAASNFDDIFNDDVPKPASPQVKKPISSKQGSSGKDKKKEIDDIFGGIVKKKKKPVSEIDSIFGQPKKKKK